MANRCSVIGCPIKGDVDTAVRLSNDLARTLRILRHDLIECENCKDNESCKLRSNFQSQVTAAITEVQEDWNLLPAGSPIHAQLNYE